MERPHSLAYARQGLMTGARRCSLSRWQLHREHAVADAGSCCGRALSACRGTGCCMHDGVSGAGRSASWRPAHRLEAALGAGALALLLMHELQNGPTLQGLFGAALTTRECCCTSNAETKCYDDASGFVADKADWSSRVTDLINNYQPNAASPKHETWWSDLLRITMPQQRSCSARLSVAYARCTSPAPATPTPTSAGMPRHSFDLAPRRARVCSNSTS